MNNKLREMIWNRDENKCRDCGKLLVKIFDEYENYNKILSDIQNINVYKFDRKCWKCNNNTPIITYSYRINYETKTIGSINKIDILLLNKYPIIKIKYSNTMKEEVIANVCINCGELQGNYYIWDELIDDIVDCLDLNQYLIDTINIKLSPEDLGIENDGTFIFDEKESFGHVHHIDHNRDNNNLDNLILLCRDCYIKRHKND